MSFGLQIPPSAGITSMYLQKFKIISDQIDRIVIYSGLSGDRASIL
ncbi:hypothetical protein [Pseudanabaena galeata]|nr:hypothetical protein [Pseudanabaena galeata]WGS73336.1 hypothetical protein OA858_04705 [Pseudanabaena galeata CCNP1313]